MKAREVKRLDAILRSHVYAQFGESLTGLATIRAYGKQQQFCRVNEQSLDVMNRAYYLTIVNQRWLGIRLDLVGDLLIFVVALLVVSSRFSVSPSLSGLVLSYCIQVVSSMGFMTRQWAEVENNMNATERLHYYGSEIENEAPWEIPDHKPPPAWPELGGIIIKDVFMKYRDGLPNVLKGLSLRIRGGERIGIGLIFMEHLMK
jgi:ATP-binding cassette, subfamily C (CFTR/MRP), member 1